MKFLFTLLTFAVLSPCLQHLFAQQNSPNTPGDKGVKKNLYIDVHQLEPGKVKYEDVAKAHAKDLVF